MNKIFIPNNYPAFCRVIILALLLSGHTTLFAQVNLVPNYSFEIYTSCPSASLNDKPDFWYKPDKRGGGYRNACANDTISGIPYNYTASGTNFQYPRTGNAYIGIAYFALPNIRNYFQVKLLDTLKTGICYYVESYVNKSNPFRLACNNLAYLFTNSPVYVDTANSLNILPATPQVTNYNNPIISDTLNWVKVSGIFTAQGGEQYLTLGNFMYDNQTNYNIVQPTGYFGVVYYVDDVSLYELDSMPLKADAGLDTTITLGDSAFIGSLTSGIPSITWYNSSGTVINTTAPGFYVSPTASTFYILEQTVCGYTSRDTINITVNLLPLHWLAFTASQFFSSISSASLYPPWGAGGPGDRGEVLLRWQTANEFNVSHYNIQRSFRGSNEFETIGAIPANNKPYNEYTYIAEPTILTTTPNTQPQTMLFRLQSIDKDGQCSYSPIRRVRFAEQTASLRIYPNPTTGIVNIEYNKMTLVTIIDAAGRTVMSKKLNNNNATQLNVSSLPKGFYIIRVTGADNTTQSQKLINNRQ